MRPLRCHHRACPSDLDQKSAAPLGSGWPGQARPWHAEAVIKPVDAARLAPMIARTLKPRAAHDRTGEHGGDRRGRGRPRGRARALALQGREVLTLEAADAIGAET